MDQRGRTAEAGAEQLQLREYLEALRARKWTILFIALLVVASALFFSFRQPPLYQSSTEVLVNPVPTSSTTQLGAPAEVNIETETRLATSNSVAEVAAEKLGEEDPQSLSRPSVEALGETTILVFTYVSTDPVQAQARAGAFAEGYLDYRYDQTVTSLSLRASPLQDQLDAEEQRLAEVDEKLESAPDDPALQGDATSIRQRIAEIESQLDQLEPPAGEAVGEVYEPASLPSAPSTPNHVRTGVLALLVGLGLGIGVTFLKERLDERLRGQADLEAHLGAGVLAMIPAVSGWGQSRRAVLITQSDPEAPASEGYRTLRTAVLFAASQRLAKTLLVTSANSEEGKTATTANLGVVLAQAGKRVILISGDLRKPRLHQFFGVENGTGLVNALAGEVTPWGAIRACTENLRLVPSGPIPLNPAELLGSEAMRLLLIELAESADLILIDSPPLLPVSDALTVTPFADAVLFVADAQKTMHADIDSARRQLERVNAQIIGAVLNNLHPSRSKRDGQYNLSYASDYHPEANHQPASKRGKALDSSR